jgi:hypothetical protein
MPYSNEAKNLMLKALAGGDISAMGSAVFGSLHSGLPGATGANEISGGVSGHEYARQALTWNAPSTGSMTLADTPLFDVPAATTVAHVGIWSALTGGIFLGYVDVTDEVFAAQGTYQITSGTFDLNATPSA